MYLYYISSRISAENSLQPCGFAWRKAIFNRSFFNWLRRGFRTCRWRAVPQLELCVESMVCFHAVRCWVVQIFQVQSENHGVSPVLTCVNMYYYRLIKYTYPLSLKSGHVCLTVPSWIGTHQMELSGHIFCISSKVVVGEMVAFWALKDVSLMSHCCSFHHFDSFWWNQVAILSFRCRFSQDATAFALAFRSVLMETPAVGPRRLN